MARNEQTPKGDKNSERTNPAADTRETAQGKMTTQPGSKGLGAESAGMKDDDRQLGRAHGSAAQRTSDLSRPNASRAQSEPETFGRKHDVDGNPTDELTDADEDAADQDDLEIDEDIDTDEADVQGDRDDN